MLRKCGESWENDVMSSPASWDVVLKVVVVGDSSVGKTSLVARFASNSFQDDVVSTIGVEFAVKTVTIKGKRVKMILWDTAGNERFRSLTGSYYRGAQLVVFVYDVYNSNSFDHLVQWMDEAELYLNNRETVKLLIGNKVDRVESPSVSSLTSLAFAQRHGMLRAEVSAKTGFCVSSALSNAVEKVLDTPSLLQTAPTGNVVVLGRNGEGGAAPPSGCC